MTHELSVSAARATTNLEFELHYFFQAENYKLEDSLGQVFELCQNRLIGLRG